MVHYGDLNCFSAPVTAFIFRIFFVKVLIEFILGYKQKCFILLRRDKKLVCIVPLTKPSPVEIALLAQ